MKPLLLTLCPLLLALSAFAERQGLVIGNRDYADTGRFGDLATTLNDAAVMHRLMTQAGFKMAPVVKDATRLGMEEALMKFCDALKADDEAVIYYAGHGIQFENKVYLMGTNAEFRIKAKLGEEAVSQETMSAMLGERGVKLAVLILDCCREVPDQSWLASDNHSRGLRGNEQPALVQPPNILVGYATSSGRLTNDSLRDSDANGPLVVALQKHWALGLEFDDLWKAVTREVLAATLNAEQGRAEIQMPSKYGQTVHDFYFVATPPALKSGVTPSALPMAQSAITAAPAPLKLPVLPPTGFFSIEDMFDATPYEKFNAYTRLQIFKQAQTKLKSAGYYQLVIDGINGKATQQAIIEYQRNRHLAVTGKLDQQSLDSLGLIGIKQMEQPRANAGPAKTSNESKPDPGNDALFRKIMGLPPR